MEQQRHLLYSGYKVDLDGLLPLVLSKRSIKMMSINGIMIMKTAIIMLIIIMIVQDDLLPWVLSNRLVMILLMMVQALSNVNDNQNENHLNRQ